MNYFGVGCESWGVGITALETRSKVELQATQGLGFRVLGFRFRAQGKHCCGGFTLSSPTAFSTAPVHTWIPHSICQVWTRLAETAKAGDMKIVLQVRCRLRGL